jgi:UDP-glucose 4-epimerase
MYQGQAGAETVVVTGATGFLGRALCGGLQAMGFRVRAAARHPAEGPWSEFVRLDVPDSVPAGLFAGARVVYHLAGLAHAIASEGDARLYDDVNGRGTGEVAQRAKASGVQRFVFMSSVKALGEPGDEPVREDQESTATDPYGKSKHNGEVAAFRLHSADFQVVVLRPVLVYGPGAKGNLESLLRFVRGGRRPPLPALKNRRSLVGVNDLTTATMLVGTHPNSGGRAYTVTDGQVYSTTDIINALAAASGVTRPAPFVLPMLALRIAGRFGDFASTVTGRRLPFTSAALQRLLSNAEYEARGLSEVVGFKPQESLYVLAEPMLRALRNK